MSDEPPSGKLEIREVMTARIACSLALAGVALLFAGCSMGPKPVTSPSPGESGSPADVCGTATPPGPSLELPLRAVHASGYWGTNVEVVEEWQRNGSTGPLVPLDYIAWLNRLHVNWAGISVALTYEDSLDSTVELHDGDDYPAPFPDDAIVQLVRDLRGHDMDVYLTLALESAPDAEDAPRWAERHQLGAPFVPDGLGREDWPLLADHPDHERFVAEFWHTYTQQAVHFARIAEQAGVRLYSLGTETDLLFRTRAGETTSSTSSNRWSSRYVPCTPVS